MITIKFMHHLMDLDENVASQKFGSTFPIKKINTSYLICGKENKNNSAYKYWGDEATR